MNILVLRDPDEEYRNTDAQVDAIEPTKHGFDILLADGSTLWVPDARVVSYRTQAAESETEDV